MFVYELSGCGFESRCSRLFVYSFSFRDLYFSLFDSKMLKILYMGSRPNHFKFFKACLPQILLGPFLNTLTHMSLKDAQNKLISIKKTNRDSNLYMLFETCLVKLI